MNKLMFVVLMSGPLMVWGQSASPLYQNLPVGMYKVGFKIITVTDRSRVVKPAYNYFGEKETGDLHKKITIHLWYPAKAKTGMGVLTYADYCYNDRLKSTDEKLDPEIKASSIRNQRESLQGFFGKISDEDWAKVMGAPMLGNSDADPVKEKFPLLIGMLRPLSTAVTNELLASNGYVVAMVLSPGIEYPRGYATEIQDMQKAIEYVSSTGMVDETTIGAYGFSGSGFSQVLFAMQDPRISALADIESGLYMKDLFDILSSSNFYNPRKLKVPFLHLFSNDLSKEEVRIDEFDVKNKYAERYRVLLNPPKLHHWDFATEGRASTTLIHVRGDKEAGIKASYELANHYLLHFFNATLKKNDVSQTALNEKKTFSQYADSLWTVLKFTGVKAPPDKNEFEQIIYKKGIDEALQFARGVFQSDSVAEFTHQNVLNQMARNFNRQNKPNEALALMNLCTEFHPKEAWLWNNLASMEEDTGNIPGAIEHSEKVLEILKDFKGTEQSFNERIRRSSAARLERLKKSNATPVPR